MVPNPTPKLTVSDLPEEKKFPFNEFPSEPIKMTAPETGASGDNASATHVPAYQAMMPPRAKLAPHFDGRYLSDFLREFETAAKLAGLTDSEMCDRVLDYCSHRIRDSYKYDDAAEKLFKGDDWGKVKDELKTSYGDDDGPNKYSDRELQEFSDECRRRHKIKNLADFRRYVRMFREKTGNLVKDHKITTEKRDFLFYQGLNSALRDAIEPKLVKAKGTELFESDPPKRSEVISAVEEYFTKDSLKRIIPNDEQSDTDDDLKDLFGDEDDEADEPRGPPKPKVHVKSRSSRDKSSSNDTEERLTKVVSGLQSTLEQVLSRLTVGPGITPTQAAANVAALARLCWMCGKEEGKDLDHRIGLGNCPSTKKFIADGIIMHNPQGRLVYTDGTDLPNARGIPGGMSTLIQQRTDFQRKGKTRDAPPHLSPNNGASTSATELYKDNEPLLGGNVYAVSSEDVNSFAMTRAQARARAAEQPDEHQKASQRFDFRHMVPSDEPVKASSKQSPQVRVQQPGEATQFSRDQAKQAEEPAITPPKVNTEQGWREREAEKKRVPKGDGDQMVRSRGKANIRFTSDVQDSVSPEQVQERILNTMISIPLKMILAVSPDLQKRMTALTKTRREVTASATAKDVDDDVEPGAAAVTVKDEKDLEEVISRYASAIAIGPRRFVAMACGLVQGKFGGEPVTFLIDSGSELNLIAKRVFAHSGVAMDEDGSRWTLRGIHGEPVPLVGCCRDAPITLGGARFDHHFFVQPGEMGRHDGILGQPWLLWFSSRLEYERGGGQDLVVFPKGDVLAEPVRVRVAGVANRRNVSLTEVDSENEDFA